MKKLFLALMATGCVASFTPDWNKPFPPHRVIGNIYYVGTNYLASYLIPTNDGHILINPNYEESLPLLEANMEKLGFHLKDIRVILLSYAQDDHCAGAAKLKKATTAKLMVMDGDVKEMQDGGKSDFEYKDMNWPAVKVDRVLHDGDEVQLANVILTAHKTPGHTKGCTTWTMRVGNQDVVIIGSADVNEGYKLIDNPKYPDIVKDYTRTFEVLRSLRCDVFLGARGDFYGLDDKYRRLMSGGSNPFIDPRGYDDFVSRKEIEFGNELRRQRKH